MRLEELFEVIKVQGDMLSLGGKEITSIPDEREREVVIFTNKKGSRVELLRKSNGKYRADIDNRSDEIFNTLKDVAKFLNKGKYNFLGVDKI